MEYNLPKDLAKHFEISVKTVYNYMNKYPDKIRIKKEFGKRFIHRNDFTQLLQRLQNPFKETAFVEDKKYIKKEFGNDFELHSKIQDGYKDLQTENRQLAARNDTLERQIKEYGELFISEKNEKKEWINKYEKLRDDTNKQTTLLYQEKTFLLKRYYILVGMSLVLALLLLGGILFINFG